MPLQPFTRNFADNSTEAGFQFTFYCDSCRDGYKTKFIESKTHKKRGLLKGLGGIARAASAFVPGAGRIGGGVGSGADVIAERFSGKSPEWHKEHEAAFELAQNEAKGYFKRCPKCKKWVCETDWNEQEGLCVEDAPRVSVEVAAAKAQKMVSDIQEKAAGTQVFTGEIESKQTMCPECGQPAGEGKFCSNCGASLLLMKCSKCGASSPTGTKFCGECGTKLQ